MMATQKRVMRLDRFSMKWKLAIGATALSIVLIWIVSLMQAHYLQEDLRESIAAQQFTLVREVAHEVDAKLNSSLLALERSAATMPESILDDPARFRDHYASRPAMLILFDDLILIGIDGIVQSDFPKVPGRVGVSVVDRKFFIDLLANNRPVIGEPVLSKVLKEPIVSMAAPIRYADGRLRGMLVGTIRLQADNFLGHMSDAKVGATGYFLILTSGSRPVYVVHPDKSRILKERPENANPSTTRALGGFEGTLEDTNSKGLHALFSYRHISSTGWLVTSVLPIAEAYAPVERARQRTAAVAILLALVVTPILWLCVWRLFAPLTLLLSSINALRSMRGERPAGSTRRDEFSRLQHAFDQLMAEREDAEKRLRHSEYLIRNTTDNLPALVCYIDRHHCFRFNNKTYEKWLKKPLAEITGKPVEAVYGSTIYPRLKSHLDRALDGETVKFDVDFRGRDGRLHFVQGTYRPEFDESGVVQGVFGLISDVTLLKEAEARLAREHDHLAAIIRGTNAGTWEWNIASGEARVNARWGEILGYTLDELAPVTIDTWISRTHPVDRKVVSRHLREHFSGEREHHEFEARMRHKDGSWIWVLGYGQVSERDAAQRPLMMHGVHLDISARKRAEEALRFSQRALQRTSDVAGVGGWEIDLATQEITWSDETCRLHDVEPGHRPDMERAIAFYEPEARPLVEHAVQQGIDQGTPWDLELPLRSATGRRFWARVVGAAEFENGVAVRLVGAFQDVTARKSIEHQLVENRQLLQTTLDSIGDAVITTDIHGFVRWLNPVAERMTGWTKDEASGQPLARVFVILNEETRMAAPDPVAACISQGKIVGLANKTLLLSRNGDEFAIEDSASPIVDPSGDLHGVVLVFHDVSEQRRLSHEMTHRATHDPLTGLVNRAEFEARLDRLARALQFDDRGNSLLFIDLDQFKIVNDACGHTAGDQLLKQVSGLMRDCVRGRDTVARLGGDEFGIILEHCNVAQAEQIAQKLCDLMEDFRFTHDGRRFRVGTSIGLVPFDTRWRTVAAAMQAADAACYAAKDAGRNRVHLWVDSDAGLAARHGDMQWVSRLELALDENRFELYGQRIEAIDGASSGLHCEVLLRLVEPDGTLVLPGVFLPAAERFHLATRIDRWVVQQVFSQMESDPDFEEQIGMIAINLSGHSIGDRAFHRTVIEQIRAASFDVRKLCFEITETVAVTNFADAKKFIDEVRAMGVKVSLDDFGAGASSFGYLKHLPVDFLKIDGQFITDLLDDALDDAAVRCFREVARVVGVVTIAEFVERQEIRELLGAIGIDMAQGYLIHRPEPLRSLTPHFA